MGIFDVGLRGFREWKKEIAGISPVQYKKVRMPIVATTAARVTELIIPAGAIIVPGSFIKVLTAEATGATKTVDIGISGGDADGFIDGLSVAAAGTILPTLADGAATVGVLNSVDESGGDLVPEGYVCTAATTITYKLGSDDFAEMDAWVYIAFVDPS